MYVTAFDTLASGKLSLLRYLQVAKLCVHCKEEQKREDIEVFICYGTAPESRNTLIESKGTDCTVVPGCDMSD